jgi:hypothetical protein
MISAIIPTTPHYSHTVLQEVTAEDMQIAFDKFNCHDNGTLEFPQFAAMSCEASMLETLVSGAIRIEALTLLHQVATEPSDSPESVSLSLCSHTVYSHYALSTCSFSLRTLTMLSLTVLSLTVYCHYALSACSLSL